MTFRRTLICIGLSLFACFLNSTANPVLAQSEVDAFGPLQAEFVTRQQEILKQYCLDCHSTARTEGELDLERFHSVSDIRADVVPWQRAVEMLDQGEMPPKDAERQMTSAQHQALRKWIRAVLDADAKANAGDPGPVVLRRLNNAELTYTIQDLTETHLEPAREFPVDSAAGEGFTNVGGALVMSPSLVQKYLDAAKQVASHAVLLPQGLEFSTSTTARDWTNEKLNEIRQFYSRYTDNSGATTVNLQGIQFETNGGGRLPLTSYLTATIVERQAIRNGQKSLSEIAAEYSLNARYLTHLWNSLNGTESSLVLDLLRTQWKDATPEDVPALVGTVMLWQQSLWRFTTIGHIGKRDGPTAWQVPVHPLASRHEIRMKLPAPQNGANLSLYLHSSDLSDGNEQDFAVWENARFVSPGRPDLRLRDIRRITATLMAGREKIFATAAACLNAAAEATAEAASDLPGGEGQNSDVQAAADRRSALLNSLAQKHDVDPEILASWFNCLGIDSGEVSIDSYLTQPLNRTDSYDFVKGWIGADALSVLANSSDELVRIPGDMPPHSVGVHPSPHRRAVIGWKSPVSGQVNIAARVRRSHLACGNGVSWKLELRRGRNRQRLAEGVASDAVEHTFATAEPVLLRNGDMISLIIGPRDGEHSCDMTFTALTITPLNETGRDDVLEWDLAKDVSPDILVGNPHPDRFGHDGAWHFYSEAESGDDGASVIPANSLLARWQATQDLDMRRQLAAEIQHLLTDGETALPEKSPDAALYRQLTSFNGPLLSALKSHVVSNSDEELSSEGVTFGLDPSMFGKHPDGRSMDALHLCVKAPSLLEVVVPAEIVEGYEFAVTTTLHPTTATEGTVQMQVLAEKPASLSGLAASAASANGGKSTWSDGDRPVSHEIPILVSENSDAKRRLIAQFDEFRELFPAALCYTKIVPVDEVVTLTLYYREDDHLRRLMLSNEEAAELDRLWDELHFISQDAFALVDAYEQLWQFATQDADPSAFTPMRDGIMRRADEFRALMLQTESVHLQAVLKFADRAWRRPLTVSETEQLSRLYRQLRDQELSHDAAIRMLIARVLVTPAFLYRGEHAPPGTEHAAVSAHELATRLSYFLWSSLPDQELRNAADSGMLSKPDVLRLQTRRLLSHKNIRRMAIEFGCQWLHIREFDQMDEKSDQHYPEFKELRADMYEESIRFFEDLFRNDRSVLELLNADHTFVNHRLATFYGIDGVNSNEWERVENIGNVSRGGILALAATLAKQSGASRTSPILRGNWVSEFLLGDKLPRPPKGVPVLPEVVPAELTERQLVELHSSDPACAKCHDRIDGFGFALEQFDTIGRLRTVDTGGHKIDVATILPDGTQVTGLNGLRDYLLSQRRDDFLRTFCRRLLGYALGRSVQLSDEPLIDDMMARLKTNDFRFSVALETIVLSPQFQMIRGANRAHSESAAD